MRCATRPLVKRGLDGRRDRGGHLDIHLALKAPARELAAVRFQRELVLGTVGQHDTSGRNVLGDEPEAVPSFAQAQHHAHVAR